MYFSITKVMPTRAPLVTPIIKRDLDGFSNKNGSLVKCDFVKFKSPWGECIEKTTKKNRVPYYIFTEAKNILLMVDDLTKYFVDTYNDFDIEVENKILAAAYIGDSFLENHYITVNTILNAKPNKISLFDPIDKLNAEFIILGLKTYSLHCLYSLDQPIYSFNTKDFKGFQFGNANEANIVRFLIFDNYNNVFEISMRGKDLKQKDIDQVLVSLETYPPR